MNWHRNNIANTPRGGGVSPNISHIDHIGMRRPKGRVFAPFWSKDFVLFGLESGMVFKGTTGVYERIYSNSKWILRNLFCCCSNLSNDDIISKRPGLSMDFRGQTV